MQLMLKLVTCAGYLDLGHKQRPVRSMMLTHERMNSSRLYVLLDAVEDDMRQMLTRYVLDHL